MSLAEARKLAKDALHLAARGQDPAAEKQIARQGDTFADLAREYMERALAVGVKDPAVLSRAAIITGKPAVTKTAQK